MLRSCLMFWLLCGAPAASAEFGVQDPEPSAPTSAELLGRLRTPGLSMRERRRIAEGVLELGGRGVDQLFRLASRQFRSRHRDFESLRDDHLRLFTAVAARIVVRRQDGPTLAEIETLRASFLKASRASDLAKATIRNDLDPVVARLSAVLEVDVESVFAAEPRLVEGRGELGERHAELMAWMDIHDRAGDVLAAATVSGARKVERDLLPNPALDLEQLARDRAAAAAAATPQSTRDLRVRERNATLRAEVDAEEWDGIVRTNRLRVLLGLPALAIDPKLCVAARGHSEDMVRLGFFSHTSPVPGKESPGKRAALAGTSGGAENIAAGQRSGQGAIRAWWYSPGHHRNMLGNHARIGLGRCESTWTQMFGG